LPLQNTPLAFLSFVVSPYIITVLAIGELISDQLPPSRKVPIQFGARLVSGGLCGAAIGATGGALIAGLLAGVNTGCMPTGRWPACSISRPPLKH
jgi:uncharacterized membrane protein